jgi:hypothetical protein
MVALAAVARAASATLVVLLLLVKETLVERDVLPLVLLEVEAVEQVPLERLVQATSVVLAVLAWPR